MEWQRFLKEAFLFFFKDVTKKGALIFFQLLQKKRMFFALICLFFVFGGEIQRDGVWLVDNCCFFFYSLWPFFDQVFWPCGIVFVMKLSQVQARIAYVQGNLDPRLIIFEIFLEQLQYLVFLVFFLLLFLFLGGCFHRFVFFFSCGEFVNFCVLQRYAGLFCTVLMISDPSS